MSPAERRNAPGLSKQGTLDLLRPVIAPGAVEKIGNKKTGRYAIC